MPTKRFENLDPRRRKAILDAARREFAASGFERASLNDIIREAGISKGSLYYYFEDKLDLYISVVKELMKEIIVELGGMLKGEFTDNFWGDMDKMYERALVYMYEHPDVVRIGQDARHLMTSPMTAGAFAEIYRYGFDIYRDIMLRGQEAGAVRTDVPIDLLVTALYSMGEGMDMWLFQHWEELSDDELKRIIRLYADFAKDIAGVKPETGGGRT